MNHSNWLRNMLPSSRINGQLPILIWNQSIRIRLSTIPTFEQPGFAFRYRSETVSNKKFLARLVHGLFVGIQSEETLFRIYVQDKKKIYITRKQEFNQYQRELLPNVASLLDGLSRQSERELNHNMEGYAEEVLVKAFEAFASTLPTTPFNNHGEQQLFRSLRFGNRLPTSFQEALR